MIEYENLGRSNQFFFDGYKKAFEKVLESGLYILGDGVSQFEKEFSIKKNPLIKKEI